MSNNRNVFKKVVKTVKKTVLLCQKSQKKNKSILTRDFFDKKGFCDVWMSHSDEVSKLPKNFAVIGSSKNSKFSMIENPKKKIFGIQFHPEVTHTKNGTSNSVSKYCSRTNNGF